MASNGINIRTIKETSSIKNTDLLLITPFFEEIPKKIKFSSISRKIIDTTKKELADVSESGNHSDLSLDDGTNPHGTTANDVGLGNVDNTSDIDKPVSIAVQSELDKINYLVSFTEIDKASTLFDFDYTITSITKSASIDTFEVSINGGAFAVPTLPLALDANDFVVFQIVFNSGEDLGVLNIKGTKN